MPDTPWIKPRPLKPGDTIEVVAPAGPLNMDRVQRGADTLRQMGFQVRVPAAVSARDRFLAGPDPQRAEAFMAAFLDPTVDAVFCARGGYGVTRMLHLLDFQAIRAHPKVLLGYSDITALHLAINRYARLVTFHGPIVAGHFTDRADAFTQAVFERTLLAESYDGQEPGYLIEVPEDVSTIRALFPGKATGRLTGGNLSLVAATTGTKYEMEREPRVLFLEDLAEYTYKLDRYLTQLRAAGLFDHVAAVILGEFSDVKAIDETDTVETVMRDRLGDLGVPVLTGFPAGHETHNATLPMGVAVEVDAYACTVRVVEDPVIR